ncbi:MAG: hypothetical protein CSA65_03170 [Proteobacteria bacterium]|nr:MAG: hypothetical protein CSB49_04255 [Pseudomonadota bacterium]PIE19136.1 MAG: hypothetical protein CSA65_03170 [Pseudomonadota bacterium]
MAGQADEQKGRPRRRRRSLLPRRWWEVLAEAPPSELPFARYFSGEGAARETAPLPSGRIIEAVEPWDEDPLVNDWFEAGERDQLHPICLEAERPPMVQRALTWVLARRHR